VYPDIKWEAFDARELDFINLSLLSLAASLASFIVAPPQKLL